MFGPSEITIILGMRGCGKSTLMKKLASVHKRVFVFDRLQEWEDENAVFQNFDEFAQWYRDHHDSHEWRILFHGGIGKDLESYRAECGAILRTLYNAGRNDGSSGSGVCVAIEEVQTLSTANSIEPWFLEVVLTGRHAKLSILANSQRPASIHKSLISQAHNLFVGQLYEPRDLEYLRDTLGDEASRILPTLPKGSFLLKRMGEPHRIVKVF